MLYKRLNSDRSEVRLLELQPSQNLDDKIVCRLVTTNITEELDFLALSYIWGDPAVNEKITVNSSKVSVPVNLAEALRHIRAVFLPSQEQSHEFGPRWLSHKLKQFRSMLPDHSCPGKPPVLLVWLDALCINQQDAGEKSEQRVNISHIYKSATMVIGWLGLDDESTALLLETIRAIDGAMPPHWGDADDRRRHPANYAPHHAWLERLRPMWEEPPRPGEQLPPAWVAIRRFYHRPYFWRGWLLEEIALARSPALLVGTTIVPWMLVLRMTLCLEEVKDVGSDVFPPRLRAMMRGLPLGSVQTMLDDLQRRQAESIYNSKNA